MNSTRRVFIYLPINNINIKIDIYCTPFFKNVECSTKFFAKERLLQWNKSREKAYLQKRTKRLIYIYIYPYTRIYNAAAAFRYIYHLIISHRYGPWEEDLVSHMPCIIIQWRWKLCPPAPVKPCRDG